MDTPLQAALKAARAKLGISINELARRASINAMGPSRWERGRPPLDLQLPIIAKAYGIPEEDVWQLAHPVRAKRLKALKPSTGMPLFKRLSAVTPSKSATPRARATAKPSASKAATSSPGSQNSPSKS